MKEQILAVMAELDDEAFVWIVLALQPSGTPIRGTASIFPDGVGGFHDSDKITRLRELAQVYLTQLEEQAK